MKSIGIVCEYNPFHNGHEYHIAQSRAALGEDTAIVCVMSGDFVQRGEAALYSKFARAEAACRCGADIVIELPLPWCLSSAEGFARGAVGILASLGVEHISFGSEAGELEALCKLAQALADGEITDEIKRLMTEDGSLSFAVARQRALQNRLGNISRLLEDPNNILAVEYLKAINELQAEIKPFTVKRCSSRHDGVNSGAQRSAMELRGIIRGGGTVSGLVPAAAMSVYRREDEHGRALADVSLLDTAAMSRLRMLDRECFDALPDGANGAGKRLYDAARTEPTIDAVLAAAKTKRYTMSRMRRMLLCACLGVKAGFSRTLPPYARILAANAKGCAFLRGTEAKRDIPVITKPAAVKELSPQCGELFAMGAAAHDFYNLGYKASANRKGGEDYRRSPVIL